MEQKYRIRDASMERREGALETTAERPAGDGGFPATQASVIRLEPKQTVDPRQRQTCGRREIQFGNIARRNAIELTPGNRSHRRPSPVTAVSGRQFDCVASCDVAELNFTPTARLSLMWVNRLFRLEPNYRRKIVLKPICSRKDVVSVRQAFVCELCRVFCTCCLRSWLGTLPVAL